MTRKLLPVISLLACSIGLSACYTHLNAPQADTARLQSYEIGRRIQGLVYTEPGWPQAMQADLSLPVRSGILPVVLTIHGGGWANRDRGDMSAVNDKLVAQGFAVLNLSYRFAPRYTHPAQLQDLQQALRWVAVNAEKYQLDVTRINTWGYSSGAHLAALIASYPSAGVDTPRINAVVAGGIPADLRKYRGSPIVMRFMGGDQHEMPRRYADASPAYHISADDPPVFLYHGNLDALVSTDQSKDYYAALQAAGVESELYLHHWRGHLTMFEFGGDAEERALRFLQRHNQVVDS